MSQLVAFNAELPAHIRAAASTNTDLTQGVGLGFPVVSIKGKIFTVVKGGERTIVMKPGEDDEVATSLEVVLLRANPNLSKIYYETGYEDGSTAKPDCFSNDGKKPDSSIATPISPTCAGCPKNAWNSGKEGKGKACADARRVAIAAAGQLNEPMLLRVPPASLKPLAEYADTCNKRGAPYNSVICKIKFEREEATPKLIFAPIAFLDSARYDAVLELANSELVAQIIGTSGAAAPAETPAATEPEKKVEKKAEPEKKVEKKAEPKEEKKVEKKAEPKVEKPADTGDDSSLLDELNSLLGGSDD